MSILARNCMSFWRENSNVFEVRLKKLTFKTFSPLKDPKQPLPIRDPTVQHMERFVTIVWMTLNSISRFPT